MRVALFITCFNDTLFPQTRAGGGDAARAARLRGRVSRWNRRAAARCTSTRATSTRPAGCWSASRACSRGYDAVVSPSASCVAHVRERIPSVRDRGVRVDRVPGRSAGRGRCRRVVPAPGDAAPDVPLAAAAADRRPAAAAAGGGARDRSRRAGGRARVLRVRRDVRDQERRHVDGDALGQGPARARHARGGVHVGRHVVPDAHRRRAARQRTGVRTMHLAEILAAQE